MTRENIETFVEMLHRGESGILLLSILKRLSLKEINDTAELYIKKYGSVYYFNSLSNTAFLMTIIRIKGNINCILCNNWQILDWMSLCTIDHKQVNGGMLCFKYEPIVRKEESTTTN